MEQTRRNNALAPGIMFIASQFVPMAVLAVAYYFANTRIEQTTLGGVRLDRLLLTSAIVAPILSQSVSGPLFRSLETVPGRELRHSAALVLRNLPRAMVLSVPVLLVISALTAHALGMTAEGAQALTAVLWMHLLFAAALVPAYAHRKGSMLVMGWTAYAVTLGTSPSVWWAPAFAGFLTQIALLVWHCDVRLGTVPLLGYRSMMVGLVRGVSLSLPLWSLPVGVYLASDAALSPVPIFLALTPALVCYQVYFVVVATPVWARIDRARDMLAAQPYHVARTELRAIEGSLRNGLWRVIGLLVLLFEVAATIAFLTNDNRAVLVVAVMAAAAAAVVAIAEVTRLTMVRDGIAPYVVSGVVLVALLAASSQGPGVLLVAHTMACLGCATATRLINRTAWSSPEHSLFWSRALRA